MAIAGGTFSAADGMGIAAAGQAIAGATQSVFGYVLQSDIIDIQKKLAMDRIKHSETMGEIERDDQLGQLEAQENKQHMVQEMQGKSLEVKEDVKQLEVENRIINAQLKESKLTEKQSAINDHSLRVLFFDYRGNYPQREERNMGSPRVRM